MKNNTIINCPNCGARVETGTTCEFCGTFVSESTTPKMNQETSISINTNKITDFDEIRASSFGLSAACIRGLWGFINDDMKLVIPCQYSDVKNFNDDGRAIVGKNSKYGIIDSKGETIISLKYAKQYMIFQNKSLGLIFAEIKEDIYDTYTYDGKYIGIFDGMRCGGIFCTYDSIKKFSPNSSYLELIQDFCYDEDDTPVLWTQDSLNSKILCGRVNGEVVQVYTLLAVINENNKCGVYDFEGNQILPIKYDEIYLFDAEKQLFEVANGNNRFHVDMQGNEIVLNTLKKNISHDDSVPSIGKNQEEKKTRVSHKKKNSSWEVIIKIAVAFLWFLVIIAKCSK